MLMRTLALLAPLLEVDWVAPDACPREEVFVERVEAQADQEVQDADAPVLRAEVVIEELDDRRWKLTLVLHGDDGPDNRHFEADSCADVVEAAAVVVAVRVVELVSGPPAVPEPEVSEVDGPTVTRRHPLSDPIATEPAPADPVTRAPKRTRSMPTRNRSRVGGWLAVQGGLALGVLPGVGGAVGVEGGVTGKGWRAGLAVHGAPLRRRDHPEDAAVQGRFDLVSGEALGCGVPAVGAVIFPLCGRVAVGAIRGEGRGDVDVPQQRWTLWSGLGASVGTAWRITRFLAPFASAQVLATLRRTSFSVGTVPGTLHETGRVAFRAWLGLEFHL